MEIMSKLDRDEATIDFDYEEEEGEEQDDMDKT